MHPAQIHCLLRMQDTTQADVARQCGVQRTSVYDVIHGRSRSQQIERRISIITGRPLAELWPQWHGPRSQRRRRHPVHPAAAAAMHALG